MKHHLYLLFSFCLCLQMFSSGQQNHFLYIQTENKQPFYVNINNNILSSSASGYLIIPRLNEGVYELNIGFPRNEWQRQTISYTIGKKDEGVLLKNYGEKGWGFYNLQNSETIMAKGSGISIPAGVEDDDNFTQVLSEVVNTPDLRIKAKVEPMPVTIPTENAVPSVQPMEAGIKRLSEYVSDQGRELVYADGKDTISIFIAAAKSPMVQNQAQKNETISVAEQTKPVAEKPISENLQKESIPAIVNDPDKVPPVKVRGINMINSNCKTNAGEGDFMKLRKKMASEENEIKMLIVAKKAFKSKCYNTSQIKNLSVLFLNDSGRFQFFESAYPFVSDSNNFSMLKTQITDPYYVTRFETLITR